MTLKRDVEAPVKWRESEKLESENQEAVILNPAVKLSGVCVFAGVRILQIFILLWGIAES